ncbi:hypothetical protein HELRODRAFT_178002 [Helobdella robusta]|uniref:Uncharacterized protein n=1 Tax=Helobdella robusta TaxID=6412 RepID=T1FCL2_HELRO|nr:hypothetical protein HELRODRAFT_178002 [Helobdella robusta]ESN97568.1 hypothetical protein HELRODRAFT_178002 [Helobdella robusta]
MRALMQLQYNANKLHIEFHQKVVALRSKYEANLESIYQALNQHSNNRNFNNKHPNNSNNDSYLPPPPPTATTTTSTPTQQNQRSKIMSNTSNNNTGSGAGPMLVDASVSGMEIKMKQDGDCEAKNKNANNFRFMSHLTWRNMKFEARSFSHKITVPSFDSQSPPPKNQAKNFRSDTEMSSLSQTNTSKNVPAFWYRVFTNSKTMLREIQIVDQPILYCLKNVKVKTDMSNLQNQKNYSFMLEFHFDTNDYFTNSILSKEYFIQLQPVGADKNCQIYWKPGMNVTEIEVRSLKNDKNKKGKKMVVMHYSKESFFNFFSTPECGFSFQNAKQREELEADYALGLYIKEKIVPKAISYFLGEVSDSSSSESSASTASSSTESLLQ